MPQEQPFEFIGRRVPGFGGFFFQGGKLVVYVTHLKDSGSARAIVEEATVKQRAALGLILDGGSAIEFREAARSFAELRDWRNEVAFLS